MRRSEEHYRQLIENALDIVTVLNPDGTIRYSSPSVESALGYLPEDLVGMDVFDLFHPDDAAGMLQAFQGTIDGQEPQPARVFHRFRFRHKDQSWRSFEAVGSRLVVGSSIEGVLVNSRDVTERERTEAALRESEERYRDLFENASDLIQSVTTDGSLEYVNKAWRDTLGYTSEDVAQLNVRDVVAPGSREDWLAMVRRVTTRQASEELEAEFVTKGGETITVEGDISCRLVDGKSVATRGIFRDITERKRAEEDMRRTLDERGVLLKEIHHRVKNNLQIISSLLYLQSGYVEDEKALEMFRESQTRVKSMALIHEKLYQSVDLARVNFKDYADSLVADLARSYRSSPMAVSIEVDVGDVGLGVDAAIPCALIINELVTNSLKYAFPDGRSGLVVVGFRSASDGMFVLSVSDDGIGVPDTFDWQNTESLGMQLVNTLTAQLGPTIELRDGSGTEFRIAFRENGASDGGDTL